MSITVLYNLLYNTGFLLHKETSFETFQLEAQQDICIIHLEMRPFTHREFGLEKTKSILDVIYKNKVIETANNFSICALCMSTIHHPNNR